MLHAKINDLGVVRGGGSGEGDVQSHWSGERRERLLQPCRIQGGGGAQGAGGCAESVFLSLVSCSPHRDDNQLTSQCFKLSSLQRQISESP